MLGYIYLVTNRVNGKIYVGQHKKQQFDSSYKGSGNLIRQAIKKYGKDKFDVVMIDTADTKEELNQKEVFYIETLNCKDHNIGYNIADGGGGGNLNVECYWKHNEMPDEMKQKMSIAAKKRYEDPEERRKCSENHADFSGEKHPMYGKHHTEEARRKISEAAKSRKLSDETKEKKSKSLKERWADPEFRKMMLDARKKKGGEKC